jgi:two-component system cell cycle response regulator DivK
MAKILIVEDDPIHQVMLSRRMQWAGYQVIIAANGLEGVKLARSEHPKLILMDMSLPMLDGWQAARQLKALPETCTIPIIALTAHAMVEDHKKSLEAGCDDHETKPIDFARLLAKMQELLSKSTNPDVTT